MKVLAGDIGGTHARLAIVEVGKRGAHILREAQRSSRAAKGLAPLVRAFLEEGGERVSRACFGVAGPVRNGKIRPTNLPWTIDAARLGHALGIERTRLINDFSAIGHGIPLLRPRDLVTLQRGKPIRHGPIAVIGPGTGLGEGYLTWNGGRYEVHASEGGHSSFAPANEVEWGLRRTLARRFGHVSSERIVSGPGLVAIYRHLAASNPRAARAEVEAAMRRRDAAAVISGHGLAGTDRLCGRALDLFVSVFGAEAGNLALAILATGGLYIGGGIAPRIIEKLKERSFLDAFRAKGRLAKVMRRIPVHVIMEGDVGMLGAAAVAAG